MFKQFELIYVVGMNATSSACAPTIEREDVSLSSSMTSPAEMSAGCCGSISSGSISSPIKPEWYHLLNQQLHGQNRAARGKKDIVLRRWFTASRVSRISFRQRRGEGRNVYSSLMLNFSGLKTGFGTRSRSTTKPPKIINVQADTSLRAWEKQVADNIVISASQHTLAGPGQHVLYPLDGRSWRGSSEDRDRGARRGANRSPDRLQEALQGPRQGGRRGSLGSTGFSTRATTPSIKRSRPARRRP